MAIRQVFQELDALFKRPRDLFGVTFSSTYSGTGATVFADQPGATAVQVKKDATFLNTHFIATRVGDSFPAGSYSSELTLRCE